MWLTTGKKKQKPKEKHASLFKGKKKARSFVIRKRGLTWELKIQKNHLSILVVLIQGKITSYFNVVQLTDIKQYL